MTYRGKVDWWIGLAVMIGPVLLTYAAVTTRPRWLIVIPVLLVGFILQFLYPQKFETSPDALVIRAGRTTRRIPYAKIVTVKPTSDSTSALAMSLDRVLIEYGTSSIMIAPDRQDEFFSDIAARAPQLTRRGQGLVVTLN